MSDGKIIFPVDAWQSTRKFGEAPEVYAQFGMLGHNGEDCGCGTGTPVVAPEDGVVYISDNNVKDEYSSDPVGGETVVIRGKYEHWLLHNSKRLVKVGEVVKQGQTVAYS